MFTAVQELREGILWLIDSECTNHMTPSEKLFARINTNINGHICVGNRAVLTSKGNDTLN